MLSCFLLIGVHAAAGIAWNSAVFVRLRSWVRVTVTLHRKLGGSISMRIEDGGRYKPNLIQQHDEINRLMFLFLFLSFSVYKHNLNAQTSKYKLSVL